MSEVGDVIDVHVWWSTPAYDVFEAPALGVLDLARVLGDDERTRAGRIREPKSRAEYVTAHALLRTALARELEVSARDVVLWNDALGAPRLGGAHRDSSLRLSLTHTDGLVACAVARSRHVGIDAEHRGRGALVDELAPTTLTEDERQAIEGWNEAARAARFLLLFTMKEAYLKARGVGLAVEMSSFGLRSRSSRDLEGLDHDVRLADEAIEADPRWHFESVSLSPEHQVSLAIELRRGETLHVVSHRA